MPFEKHTGPNSDSLWRSHDFSSSMTLMMCPRAALPFFPQQEPFQAADMNAKYEIPYLHPPHWKGLGESEPWLLLAQAYTSVGKLRTEETTPSPSRCLSPCLLSIPKEIYLTTIPTHISTIPILSIPPCSWPDKPFSLLPIWSQQHPDIS